MNTVRSLFVQTSKDLRVYFRDRIAVALGFGLPVILVLGFGFVYEMAFGGGGGFTRTELVVVDRDGSEASRRFVERLRASSTLEIETRDAERVAGPDDARRLVAEGEAHHVLLLPAGFGDAIEARRLPTLRLVRDPGREIEDQLVAVGLFQAFLGADMAPLSAELTTRALVAAGLPESAVERARRLSRSFTAGIERLFSAVADEPTGDPGERPAPGGADAKKTQEEDGKDASPPEFADLVSRMLPLETEDVVPPERPRQLTFMLAHNMAGMAVMMLMFGLVACGSLLLAEAEEGTLARLFLAPTPRTSVLWAKFLFSAIVGLGQLVVVYLTGALFFHIDLLRSPVTLVAISLAVVFSVSAFGMLVAALARSKKQAEGASTVVILVMSALGGAWFPIQTVSLPPAGEVLCRSTITWWAMSAYQGMLWYGKDLGDVGLLRDLAVLVAIGVVAAIAARALFLRRFLAR